MLGNFVYHQTYTFAFNTGRKCFQQPMNTTQVENPSGVISLEHTTPTLIDLNCHSKETFHFGFLLCVP